MAFGLSDNDVSKICEVFSSFKEIEKAVIFGSRAKGNFKAGSDIDITLTGKNLHLYLINEIDDKLDDLLLPYMFDLSIFSQIKNKDLTDHINRVGKVFYERQVAIL